MHIWSKLVKARYSSMQNHLEFIITSLDILSVEKAWVNFSIQGGNEVGTGGTSGGKPIYQYRRNNRSSSYVFQRHQQKPNLSDELFYLFIYPWMDACLLSLWMVLVSLFLFSYSICRVLVFVSLVVVGLFLFLLSSGKTGAGKNISRSDSDWHGQF